MQILCSLYTKNKQEKQFNLDKHPSLYFLKSMHPIISYVGSIYRHEYNYKGFKICLKKSIVIFHFVWLLFYKKLPDKLLKTSLNHYCLYHILCNPYSLHLKVYADQKSFEV